MPPEPSKYSPNFWTLIEVACGLVARDGRKEARVLELYLKDLSHQLHCTSLELQMAVAGAVCYLDPTSYGDQLRERFPRITLNKVLKDQGFEHWRESCKSLDQLSKEEPKYLLQQLIPKGALTALCAPSYNCKTWFALACALALSTGQRLWDYFECPGPVPVIYHVPEMNEAWVRKYMDSIGFNDSENMLVRPMECGLWRLGSPQMLESSRGRVVFLDTAGYFNEADDTSNYQQSLKFAMDCFSLIQNGALTVVGLFHPPKYAKQADQDWSLENSILGSAGYGGILRSCLRMENRAKDLNNAADIWVYVQGFKNPGLKPFQLCGPPPLKMKVEPGSSPYRSDLDSDPRKMDAFRGFEKKVSHLELAKQLGCSMRDLTRWRQEWKELYEDAVDQVAEVPDVAPLFEGGSK